jgi:hypothetical protein
MHGPGAPTVWIHGHIHSAHDYEVGDTRIVSNPRGYPHERTNFDEQMAVEVGLQLTTGLRLTTSLSSL